jgi:hypothetical protein
MAKGFKGQGKYSDDAIGSKDFDRDTSFFDNPQRAGEGESTARPKLKGWNTTSAGFGGPAKPLGVTPEVDKD